MRLYIWLPFMSAWTAFWGAYALLIVVTVNSPVGPAMLYSARATAVAAVTSLGVWRMVDRLPWPTRVTPRFFLTHAGLAVAFAVIWVLVIDLSGLLLFGDALGAMDAQRFLIRAIIGLSIYGSVASVSYALRATDRAAQAEAVAARTRLEALKRRLNPHFLFNSLNSVLVLIRRDPHGAEHALEQLSALLRRVLDDGRDEVRLADEWEFVTAYLDLERTRLGRRLKVDWHFADGTADAILPSFAVQTLIENAVRHAASDRTEPTTITVHAAREEGVLIIRVTDDGPGAEPGDIESATGLGLRALRERLAGLGDEPGRLTIDTATGRGFCVKLTIPQPEASVIPVVQ